MTLFVVMCAIYVVMVSLRAYNTSRILYKLNDSMRFLTLKNILIHILLIPFYLLTQIEVSQMPVERLDTLLLFVGLIVIAPITSNFIYTYKDAKTQKAIAYGHMTTFFSMLVVGMLFITLDVLLILMVGNVFVFRLSLILFWIAVITFDFADFLAREKR